MEITFRIVVELSEDTCQFLVELAEEITGEMLDVHIPIGDDDAEED